MGNVGRPLGRVKVYFQLHSGQKWEPSHFSLISQARKVELRHFKSLRSLLDMGNVKSIFNCTPGKNMGQLSNVKPFQPYILGQKSQNEII